MQSIEAIWSITPLGTPTNAFSARCASSASSAGGSPRPSRSASAAATEHSSAADEDRPAPCGTSPSTVTVIPPGSCPASRKTQTTPATYAAQPSTDPGSRSATASRASASDCCAEWTASRPSPRRSTAAVVAYGSASGSTYPSL